MGKIEIKVLLEAEDYDRLVKRLREEKNRYKYSSLSAAGRRAFHLLLLELDGRIEIKDRKKPASPY